MPPPPGLAPWPITISMASAARRSAGVEPVARRQALVDQQPGRLALLRGHAAVAGGGGGAHRGGRPAQRLLGVRGQRAEAHPGDRDRDGQLERAARRTGCRARWWCRSAPGSPPAGSGTATRSGTPGRRTSAAAAWRPSRGSRSGRSRPSRGSGRSPRAGSCGSARCPSARASCGFHQYFWSFSASKWYSCWPRRPWSRPRPRCGRSRPRAASSRHPPHVVGAQLLDLGVGAERADLPADVDHRLVERVAERVGRRRRR